MGISNDQLFEYLKNKIPNFIKTTKNGSHLFNCPNGVNHRYPSKTPSATFSPNGNIHCLICSWKGTMYDAIRVLEPEKKNNSDAEITAHLINSMKLDTYKELDFYQTYGWELIPLLKASKDPIPEPWKENHYKEKIRWIKWLNNELNMACKTGEINNITVIDIDNKTQIPEELKQEKEDFVKLLTETNTLTATTPHLGMHFVFQYDKEIPQLQRNKNSNRLVDIMEIDIRNDGGYFVVAPSIFDNKNYKFLNLGIEIKKIPEQIKLKLLGYTQKNSGKEVVLPKIETNETAEKGISYLNVGEGRNNLLTSLGGAFINKFSTEDTAYILSMINRNYHKPPSPDSEIKAMLKSLSGYKGSDEKTEREQVENYCKSMMTDIKADDIVKSVFKSDREKRGIVDKYLSLFRKEGWLLRVGVGRYQCKEQIGWTKEIPPPLIEISYKIPYFNDVAIFEDGDMLLLGLRANSGKTTISLNIIKEMIAQNVTPYYLISGEASSRWQKISDILGITGKFYRENHPDPLRVELAYNAFTIIDWMHFEDKSQVDVMLKHLNDELQRKRGILIIFTQLKDNDSNDWFSPNSVLHYPPFAARYIQDNYPEKTVGHWQLDKVKEMRGNQSLSNIICEYDPETKIFKKKELI